MGTIKDIADLTKDLETNAKDRRDIELIHKLRSLVISLQSEHADTIERDIRLMEENAELKRQLAEAQAAQEEEIRVDSGIEFRRGKRTGGTWMLFCPNCHMPAQEVSDGREVVCSVACGWIVAVPPPNLHAIISRLRNDSKM